MKKIFLILVTIISFIFSQELENTDFIDTWFKFCSDTESASYGKIFQIDMSNGYTETDGEYVYLFVIDKNTNNSLTILFPIGYWKAWHPVKVNKEYINLEEYLKAQKGKGNKIERK